jgi:hypothetical protein
MDATEIITGLLHDPKSFEIGQTVKMLYLEPVELCDRQKLTRPMKIMDTWENIPCSTTGNHRTKRFNYVAIGRGDASGSKVVDLRDAVLVAPNTEFTPLELR